MTSGSGLAALSVAALAVAACAKKDNTTTDTTAVTGTMARYVGDGCQLDDAAATWRTRIFCDAGRGKHG